MSPSWAIRDKVASSVLPPPLKFCNPWRKYLVCMTDKTPQQFLWVTVPLAPSSRKIENPLNEILNETINEIQNCMFLTF